MDDFVISNLQESRNEWCSRLVSIFTPLVEEGLKSIFEESWKICVDNDEMNKYLMTFQNLLSRIPKWNSTIIEDERKRIIERSGCNYLEDLITCVHIIQLKALTCIRVGLKQKKIDIDIPSLDKFIHKVYINLARKLYSNVYLFEQDVYPLQKQKNNRELEILVKEAILNTIRDNIPVEHILRVYIDEMEEQEEVTDQEIVKKEVEKLEKEKELLKNEKLSIKNKEELESENPISEEIKLDIKKNNYDELDKIANTIEKNKENLSIDFSDIDKTLTENGKSEDILAPKDLDTLEKKSQELREKEKAEEENEKLDIGNDIDIDINSINLEEPLSITPEIELDDIEEL